MDALACSPPTVILQQVSPEDLQKPCKDKFLVQTCTAAENADPKTLVCAAAASLCDAVTGLVTVVANSTFRDPRVPTNTLLCCAHEKPAWPHVYPSCLSGCISA